MCVCVCECVLVLLLLLLLLLLLFLLLMFFLFFYRRLLQFEHRTLSFTGRSRVDSLFVNEEQKLVVSVVTYLRLLLHF